MKDEHPITYTDKVRDFLSSDTTKAQVTKVVLCTLAITSVPIIVGTAAAVGNGIQVFKLFNYKKYKKREIDSTIASLKQRKLVEYISDRNGVTTVRITKKGKSVVKRFAIDSMRIDIPKKWNGKWHVVMFDIPIRFSKARSALRFKLKQLGFVQFQKSVWIYPYTCEDEILFVADYYKVRNYIEFIEAVSVSRDFKFKKYFRLL